MRVIALWMVYEVRMLNPRSAFRASYLISIIKPFLLSTVTLGQILDLSDQVASGLVVGDARELINIMPPRRIYRGKIDPLQLISKECTWLLT